MTNFEAFIIKKDDAYIKWDAYCCESLENAKEYMSTKHSQRFRSVDIAIIEARRIISVFGFDKFVIIIGLLISGVTVAGIISILSGSIAGTAGLGAIAAAAAPVAAVGVTLGTGGIAYHAWKIYTNRQLLIIIKRILVNYKTTFDENQPGLSHKLALNDLFVECIKEIIVELYETEIFANDLTVPMNPICLCGHVLTPKHASECYSETYKYVLCDLCNQQIKKYRDVFHCTKEFVKQHRQGYDICISCARKHNDRLAYYNVLIIQTLSAKDDSHGCQDANKLKDLFNNLNYHSVVTLQEHAVTKDNVTKNLRQMSKQSSNDVVVVVCFTGHGMLYGQGLAIQLNGNEFITDEEIYACLTSDNSFEYGLNGMLRESTYDILLLINACHSGGFRPMPANERQINTRNLFDEYLRLNTNISPETYSNIEEIRESTDDLPQQYHDYIKNWFKIFDDVSHSAMVISSCEENEESNFFGHVSPFFRYIIDVFTTTTNVTPDILYENLQQRTHDMLPNLQTNLHNLEQHAQQAFMSGHFAGKTKLKPIVKSYD